MRSDNKCNLAHALDLNADLYTSHIPPPHTHPSPFPQLVALLREVKYLQQRESMDHVIPESAATVFGQNETYRKFLQVCTMM